MSISAFEVAFFAALGCKKVGTYLIPRTFSITTTQSKGDLGMSENCIFHLFDK